MGELKFYPAHYKVYMDPIKNPFAPRARTDLRLGVSVSEKRF